MLPGRVQLDSPDVQPQCFMKPVQMTSAERDVADSCYRTHLRKISFVGLPKSMMPEMARRYRVVLCRRFPQMEASFKAIGLSL